MFFQLCVSVENISYRPRNSLEGQKTYVALQLIFAFSPLVFCCSVFLIGVSLSIFWRFVAMYCCFMRSEKNHALVNFCVFPLLFFFALRCRAYAVLRKLSICVAGS